MNRGRSKSKSGESKYALLARILLAVAIVFIIASLFFIMRDPYLQVKSVRVSGPQILDSAEFEEIAEQILAEYRLWIIPKTNIFLLPRGEIKDAFREKSLTINDIRTNLDNLELLNIEIKERIPKYLYCSEIDMVESDPEIENLEGDSTLASIFGEECFFVDETGLIFMEAPYFSDNVYVKFLGENDGILGEQVFGGSNFTAISSLLPEFARAQVFVKKIIEGEFGDIIMKLSKIGDRPLYGQEELRINLNIGVEKLITELALLLEQENFVDNFFAKQKSLEYIDLRFDNKLIYKFSD